MKIYQKGPQWKMNFPTFIVILSFLEGLTEEHKLEISPDYDIHQKPEARPLQVNASINFRNIIEVTKGLKLDKTYLFVYWIEPEVHRTRKVKVESTGEPDGAVLVHPQGF